MPQHQCRGICGIAPFREDTSFLKKRSKKFLLTAASKGSCGGTFAVPQTGKIFLVIFLKK
jgi:hypothetical protein